jgi:hypothetical protein
MVDQVESTTNFRAMLGSWPTTVRQSALLKFNVATGGCSVTRATLALTVGT